MTLLSLILCGIATSPAAAAVHNLFVGNLGGPARLHALAFDDESNSLTKLRTFEADANHAWITFDVRTAEGVVQADQSLRRR